ncbi:MAG: hypothetical protein H8D67_26645 [Deltaproteobacteria bacterium]|nr:hypothetical protein [Deltaproteobacteria bacterium]
MKSKKRYYTKVLRKFMFRAIFVRVPIRVFVKRENGVQAKLEWVAWDICTN